MRVRGTGDPQPRGGLDQRAQHRHAGQRGGHRLRICVQVEEPTHPGDQHGQVREIRDPCAQPQPPRTLVHAQPGRAAGQAQRAGVGGGGPDLHAVHRMDREPHEQPAHVQGLAVAQGQVHLARLARCAVPRGPGARAARPQLLRGHVVDLADHLVALTDAREPRGERGVRDGQVRLRQQGARRLRSVGAGERERSGAEFLGQHAGEVPRGIPHAPREPQHALAVHDALGDEPHGAPHHVPAQIPLRGPRHGFRDTAFAGAVPGGVRGRARAVEAHGLAVGRARGAARAAVDPGGAHRGHELPVEAPVPGLDGPVALVERGVLRGHASHVPTPGRRTLAGFGHDGGPDDDAAAPPWRHPSPAAGQSKR